MKSIATIASTALVTALLVVGMTTGVNAQAGVQDVRTVSGSKVKVINGSNSPVAIRIERQNTALETRAHLEDRFQVRDQVFSGSSAEICNAPPELLDVPAHIEAIFLDATGSPRIRFVYSSGASSTFDRLEVPLVNGRARAVIDLVQGVEDPLDGSTLTIQVCAVNGTTEYTMVGRTL